MRNITIHIAKFVAVVLVIGIHIPYPLVRGGYEYVNHFFQQGITRIAVPLFFAVLGYYLYANISKRGANYFKKYVRRIIWIAAIWGTIYMICYVPDKIALNQNPVITLAKIVWTYVFGYYHLWYLTALIIGSWGIWYTVKNKLLGSSLFPILCGILYMIGALFNVYGTYIENELFLKIKSAAALLLGNAGRNGVFLGFPMMIIGALICKYDQLLSGSKIKLGLLISSLILLAEMVLVMIYFLQPVDFYISMPAFVFFLVSYLITDPLKTTFANSFGFLITTDLSLGVYLIHLIIIKLVMPYLNILDGLLSYLTVIVISVLFVLAAKKALKNSSATNYF